MNYHNHFDTFRVLLIIAALLFAAYAIIKLRSVNVDWRYFGIACLIFAFVFALTGCGTTTITPQQAKDWADVGHTVVHNGLIDAKDVITVTQ